MPENVEYISILFPVFKYLCRKDLSQLSYQKMIDDKV